MWPGKMTRSIPIARVAVIDNSVINNDKLRAPRNCDSATAKNTTIRSSAIPIENSRMFSRLIITLLTRE